MAQYSTYTRSTVAAGSERMEVGLARSVGVAAAPIDANIRIRFGSGTAAELPISRGGAQGFGDPFSVMVVSWDATASGEDFTLVVSPDQYGAADLVKSSYTTVAAEDGDLVSIGAVSTAKVTDPDADATVIGALKGILAQLQTTTAPTGIPDIASITCTLAATEYPHDVNAVLARNARWLTVRARGPAPDGTGGNTGVVSFAVSAGAGFSGWFNLNPGDAYNLEGADVASLKVKSTGAGDIVDIEAH